MSQICTEEVPVARLRECWGLAGLESGELLRNGVTTGPIVVWPSRVEAEDAAERLKGRYLPVRVRTE